MHYCVESDAFRLHLLGRGIRASEFGPTYWPDAPSRENHYFTIWQRRFDPPSASINERDWLHVDSVAGFAYATSLEEGDVLPIRPADHRHRARGEPMGAESKRVPAVHVSNPGGTLDIYYDGDRPPQGEFERIQPRRQSRYLGIGTGPPWVPAPALGPAVDRRDGLMQWVEQCAEANGIVTPYMQANFVAESLQPSRRPSGQQPSPDETFDEVSFDLPPLHAMHDDVDNAEGDDEEGEDSE